MLKTKYIFIILISLILLTGCSANANIIIDYDGSVNENIDITNNNKKVVYGNKSIEESIQLYIDKYKTALEVSEYDYNIHTSNNISGVNIYRNYNNICNFVNNTIFSQYLYNSISCTEDDSYYVIQSIGNVIKNTDRYDSWLAPADITLSISLPIKATEQNADKIDGNNYIWKYGEDTQEDKSFYLKISKSMLKNAQKKYNEEQRRKEKIKRIITVSVIGGLLIIIIGVSLYLYIKYKNNKIDYS